MIVSDLASLLVIVERLVMPKQLLFELVSPTGKKGRQGEFSEGFHDAKGRPPYSFFIVP